MNASESSRFRERVFNAAAAALESNGRVGPIELFVNMGFLSSSAVEAWRKGNQYYPSLEPWIQVGPAKLEKTLQLFREWIEQRGLRPIQASYTRNGVRGPEELRVTVSGDPEQEAFYRTQYVPGDLPEKKVARIKEKANNVPDLVVFEKVSDEGNCSECNTELERGAYLVMEKGQPLCLACADLDHLVFLPAGDMALSRRARKNSTLSAVVVRFNRSRKRYERQGLLVTEEALSAAETDCARDASERAVARQHAKIGREKADAKFVAQFAEAILKQYPRCPADEAKQIAAHAAVRSSGRVGRSAAARELDPHAIDLAVIAHIRHQHTNYDQLLMQGIERLTARTLVRSDIDRVLGEWRGL